MAITRSNKNPVICKCDVKPSREDFEVIGVFNPGVTKFNEETILMVRVAETPINKDPNKFKCPVYDVNNGKVTIKSFDSNDASFDFSDPRVIYSKEQNFLTSMSHLRVARSFNGDDFVVEDFPALMPSNVYEAFGIEDARITYIDDKYYINYSCASMRGITTCLASTENFNEFKREGIIFHPDNKDVAIFPEKINGKYYALHRPSCSHYGKPEMWIAESPDLKYWGVHRHLAGVRHGCWEGGRIGASAVPFRTERGWMEIYHGATEDNRYCMGAMLLDINEPWKVLARSEKPLIEPEESYEVEGFFGNVVFSCGALVEGENVKIYYGAADESVAIVDLKLDDIYKNLNL